MKTGLFEAVEGSDDGALDLPVLECGDKDVAGRNVFYRRHGMAVDPCDGVAASQCVFWIKNFYKRFQTYYFLSGMLHAVGR